MDAPFNQVQQAQSEAGRRPTHIEIDDELCHMQEAINALDQLINEIGGNVLEAEPKKEPGCGAVVTMTELLHTSADRLRVQRNAMLDKITYIHDLLF